ncbi:unnamed protein product, partial [Allacma fusca]
MKTIPSEVEAELIATKK